MNTGCPSSLANSVKGACVHPLVIQYSWLLCSRKQKNIACFYFHSLFIKYYSCTRGNILIQNVLFTDHSEGGPSKLELLELLQYCDVTPGSLVSSTFSSRAPSPSPSLMSIMYPSIRPPVAGGRGSITASPLSTPLLSVGRPRTQAESGSHRLSNLFRPISLSRSGSSTSLGEGVASKESVEVATSRGEVLEERTTPLVQEEEAEEAGLSAERQEGEANPGEVLRCRVDAEGSVHQRSRSNEMDYVSLRTDGERRRPKLYSFRSPPGSMQTFQPLGTSCPLSGELAVARTDDGGTVSRAVGERELPSLGKPGDAKLTATERESKSEPRDCDGEGGKASVPGAGDRFSWLKDFDSSLWSDYFTTLEDSRYSDC